MKKTVMITDLQEKEVLSSEGTRLGYVSNVVVDTSTGKVVHLLVVDRGLPPLPESAVIKAAHKLFVVIG